MKAKGWIAMEKILSAGEKLLLDKSVRLEKLTIAEDAAVCAGDGKCVTMTVDGVNKPMFPGIYAGDIALTVTESFGTAPYDYRAALYIEDNVIVPEKSVLPMAGNFAEGIRIVQGVDIISEEENVNGIYVTGVSNYIIDGAVINMTGNGGNDFCGYGAAVMAADKAKLKIRNSIIFTDGAIRTAIFSGDHSEITVEDCYIETKKGVLPTDYRFNVKFGKMKEVPWPLGLQGNCRATNLADHGTAYYINSHIKADGWGCLSTDGVDHVNLIVKDCVLETVNSGYGAFSIGDCHDRFSNCTFNITDICIIMAEEGSATFTDGCRLNSGRYGATIQQGGGGGTLTLEKGTVMHTKDTAIEVKGIGTNIIIDNAKVISDSGVLLVSMETDDPVQLEMMKPGGDPTKYFGLPDEEELKERAEREASGEKFVHPEPSVPRTKNINVSLRNTNLTGDIIHGMIFKGDMKVTLEEASLIGSISSAEVTPKELATAETWYMIGQFNSKRCEYDNEHMLEVVLDSGSVWVLNDTSYITGLSLAEGASVTAPSGKTLTMTVDGVKTAIKPGLYTGKITLAIS